MFRSVIACSRAATLGSLEFACNLRSEAEVSGRSFDTDGGEVDEVGTAKDEVDDAVDVASWRWYACTCAGDGVD